MSSSDKPVDLSRLDADRLRRISKNLPTGLADAIQRLADQAEAGSADPKALQGLSQELLSSMPQLQSLLASVPGLEPQATALPPELRNGLAELRAGVRSPEVRRSLVEAERHAQEVEDIGADLGRTIEGFKTDLKRAGQALAERRAPEPSTTRPEAVQQAQARLRSALAGFAAAIGRGAKDALRLEEPQAHALAELWLGTLAALSVPEASTVQLQAADTCFQAALRAGSLERAQTLATALTASAMAGSDWERAAVIQHTLADAARESGDRTLLVRSRSKEALLLAQAPAYAATAEQMMSEMRTLTEEGPAALRALALLHSGDVALQTGHGPQAQKHWEGLLTIPDINAEQPELTGRALASLGYLKLDQGSYKAAARYFKAALPLAERQGGWELMGPAIRGQLSSLVQGGQRAEAQQALQHAKRLALAHGGGSGAVALADLAKGLGLSA